MVNSSWLRSLVATRRPKLATPEIQKFSAPIVPAVLVAPEPVSAAPLLAATSVATLSDRVVSIELSSLANGNAVPAGTGPATEAGRKALMRLVLSLARPSADLPDCAVVTGTGVGLAAGVGALPGAGATPLVPLRCKDSMRPWKLVIWAREKRCAESTCAASNPVTLVSRVGSGRPTTVTRTVAAGELPAMP